MAAASDHRVFIERIVIALALVALALVLWTLSSLLILVFAAIVVAIVLNALAGPLARHTRLSEGVALVLVVVALGVALVAAGWAFGAQLGRELRTLQDTLPAAWAALQQRLAQSDLGSALQDSVGGLGDAVSEVVSRAGTLAMSFGGGIANLLVVLVGAVYLAAQPCVHRRPRRSPTAAARCGCGWAGRPSPCWRSGC
ncbi:AI-2E family transporter [Coralloluteibacterium stylophorae]|uniref:AI-2E family transporter n=1 Tax=Coralloluteibacterium stylophorae TaxID=1776034 RepID=UPI0030841E3F